MIELTLKRIDWYLLAAALVVVGAGLAVIYSFAGIDAFFERQLIWASLAILTLMGLSMLDFRFLRGTGATLIIFGLTLATLATIFILGDIVKGAQSRFDVGFFAIQPADPAKLVVILLLAKYFSRRHIEIANIRHILISGAYVAVIAGLVFLQPDFGSAIIIGAIWFGMVLVAGISKKHLAALLLLGLVVGAGLWSFGLEPYQKTRILTFLDPLTDIQGAGYNARQSMIAVGSGGLLGQGFGYGTQSRLQFLPEYRTDFIFAAFSEEWGFVGIVILFGLYGFVLYRILRHASHGETNFEMLFGAGLAILFVSHLAVHIGINIGLLPVTGTTIPFMSYGGSHLLTEFAGLGILMGMSRYARPVHRSLLKDNEFLGM